MKDELDDVDETEKPAWRNIEIPILTQVLLKNCKGSPSELTNELLKLRHDFRKFRKTLTEQSKALNSANTRRDKRKVRVEKERAWAALIEKEDRSSRITHTALEIAVNPVSGMAKKSIDKDKLNQAVLKVKGLTDIWNTLCNAPNIEQNTALVSSLFSTNVQADNWNKYVSLIRKLEILRMRNAPPDLPDIS
jgi:hypothetical protein